MTPHRCPVCCGTGLVPQGFYSGLLASDGSSGTAGPPQEPCRSCERGIVWEPAWSVPMPGWPASDPSPTGGGRT